MCIIRNIMVRFPFWPPNTQHNKTPLLLCVKVICLIYHALFKEKATEMTSEKGKTTVTLRSKVNRFT